MLLLTFPAGSQEETFARKIDTLKSMAELDNAQPLKPGYIISIRILEDKRVALQQDVAVTGEIQAPYIGSIKVEGLTCHELAFKIKPELEKRFFKDATVLVTLDAVKKVPTHFVDPDLPFVVAFGTIAKQGKYDFESIPGHKLSALIKRAGGFTSADTIPKIRVIRKTSEGNKTVVVDGKALLSKSAEADLTLQASDVVIVE